MATVKTNNSTTITHIFLLLMVTSVKQPAKIYIYQLFGDAGYRLEDLPRAMADKNRL